MEQLLQFIQKEGYTWFEDMEPEFFYHTYGANIRITDKSFGLLYGWSHRFHYCFKVIKETCVIAGLGLKGELEFYLVMESPDDIRHGLDEIIRLHDIYQMPVIIDCVDDWELPYYLKQEDFEIVHRYQPDFSDYVYGLNEYMMLNGNQNRHKRQKMNYVNNNYPKIQYVEYRPWLEKDVMEVMEQWCSQYSCEKCIFGCEKKTLERLLKKYQEEYFKCGLLYIQKEPLSFALFERINNRELACLIQKNRKRMSGITYYLSYLICRSNCDAAYLNLGEDMGLIGLKEDKASYHPEFMLKKHRLHVQVKQKKGENSICLDEKDF